MIKRPRPKNRLEAQQQVSRTQSQILTSYSCGKIDLTTYRVQMELSHVWKPETYASIKKTKPKMQQLTLLQHALLTIVRDGQAVGHFSTAVLELADMGLIRFQNGLYKIVPGKAYNYRGNTYTL